MLKDLLTRACLVLLPFAGAGADSATGNPPQAGPPFTLERITTAVPFPRGLQLVDGQLYALARGRVREYGGVSLELDDQAGTLYVVDPEVAEAYSPEVGQAVRENGRVFARPSAPPFRLFDRSVSTPTKDRETDRPYCSLRYHEATSSFYLCAFSGIDKPDLQGQSNFSKNLSDALLRFDLRTQTWYEVERHNIEAGGNYPHHDTTSKPAPHGWLNGPDNCLAVENQLYAVAKDNSRLVRYDLSALVDDPEAGAPESFPVLGESLDLDQGQSEVVTGHSALAFHAGWLYVATRSSSHIFRLLLDAQGLPSLPLTIQLVARFDPYDSQTGKSANITDIDTDAQGRIYAVSAKPARIYRFTPDPKHVYDARNGAQAPWYDLAAALGNPSTKSENLLLDEQGRVYITTGDAYAFQNGVGGTIWRITPNEPR